MQYLEPLLLTLMNLRRFVLAAVALWVLLLVWLAARRAGRRGLEIAIPMWALALVLFLVAVFAPRPPLRDILAVALVLLSALLLVGSLAAIVLAARRPRVVKRRRPPWEGEGW